MKARCTRCKMLKTPDKYHKNKRMKNGLAGWCKTCVSAQARERRDADRKAANEVRVCECGCGETFVVKKTCKTKHIAGHREYEYKKSTRPAYIADHCFKGGEPCGRYPTHDCFGSPEIHKKDGSCRVESTHTSPLVHALNYGGVGCKITM